MTWFPKQLQKHSLADSRETAGPPHMTISFKSFSNLFTFNISDQLTFLRFSSNEITTSCGCLVKSAKLSCLTHLVVQDVFQISNVKHLHNNISLGCTWACSELCLLMYPWLQIQPGTNLAPICFYKYHIQYCQKLWNTENSGAITG